MHRIPYALRLIASAFALWVIIVVAFFLCLANALHGQPEPTIPPEVQQLRDLSEKYSQLDSQLRNEVERRTRLEIELGALEQGAMQPYWPGDPIRPGGRYRLGDTPLAYSIKVDQPDVWFIGGRAFPAGAGPCIEVKSTGCVILGVDFRVPNAPASGKKLGVGPCVVDRGSSTRVINCAFDDIDGAVLMGEQSRGLAVIGSKSAKSIRSNFFYGEGGQDFVVALNEVLGSEVEIPIRFSPNENKKISERGIVALNDVWNAQSIDDKGVGDSRQARDLIVAFNGLHSLQGVTAAGVVTSGVAWSVGPPVDGDHPADMAQVAERVYLIGNDCYNGRINLRAGAKSPWVIDNRIQGMRLGIDVAVYVTGAKAGMTLERPTIRNNVAYVDGATSKPVVRVVPDGVVIQGADVRDNRWESRP